MAKKLLYIFIISVLFKICKSSTQVYSVCSKEDKTAILLDTANDFITRAKDSAPTCVHDIYHFTRREKSSSLLETAATLISAAKNKVATGGKASKYKVVCIFESKAYYWSGDSKFEISHIDPYLCTHIAYEKAKLRNNQMESEDPYLDLDGPGQMGGYKTFNSLKHKNPNLKTLLFINENESDDSETDKFANMAADQTNRTTFVSSVAPFLKKYGFDGLHVNWKYPLDKRIFLRLLQDLKASLNPHGLLLSAHAPFQKYWIDRGYDIPEVSKALDLWLMMTYFYGLGKPETFINSPLYASEEDVDKELTVDFTVNYLLNSGAAKEKLVVGLAVFGTSFTLADATQHGLRAPIAGPGQKGPLLGLPGHLKFNEICLNLAKKSWNSVYDWRSKSYYAYKGDQWVSYDDIYSLNIKMGYIIEKGLSGAFFEIHNDDFRGNCYGRKYPLLNTVASRLLTP